MNPFYHHLSVAHAVLTSVRAGERNIETIAMRAATDVQEVKSWARLLHLQQLRHESTPLSLPARRTVTLSSLQELPQ